MRRFSERIEPTRHTIDYLGSGLLAGGCALLILALLEGGVAWAWSSAPGIVIPIVGLLLLAAFGWVENRAAEPVLPGWLFRNRVLVGGNLAALAVGGLLFGLSSYVPTYVQTVIGTGPLVAGLALAALTVGWPIAAALSGRFYLRIGFRDTALIGALFAVAGSLLAAQLDSGSTVWQVAGTSLVIGVGLGFVSSPLLVAAQSAVGWSQRGVATGTTLFSRSIGSALGVAVFGAIANATLVHGADRDAVSTAAQHVFAGLIVVAVLMLVAVLVVPRRVSTS
jgi:Na+/melibiose symporter-like transporter